MPQMDPLEHIMGQLRNAGSIDPARKQQRQAQMQPHRRRMGAAPGAQPFERPPQDELGQTLEDIGESRVEEGHDDEDRVGVRQGDMSPVIVDQLNETILSLKVQIHRERDPERRRAYERQAQQIREQVQNMGGEPIYADETIEEGLQKLQGHGYIGRDQLQEELTADPRVTQVETDEPTPREGEIRTAEPVRQEADPTIHRRFHPEPDTQPPADPGDQVMADLGLAEEPQVTGRGYHIPIVPTPAEGKVRVYGNPVDLPLAQRYLDPEQYEFIDTSQLAPGELQPQPGDVILGGEEAIHGPEGQEFTLTDRDVHGAIRIAGETRTETAQELQNLMREQARQFEYEDTTTPAPEPHLDEHKVNQIMQEYGVEPKSQEEIRDYADALVERQALGKRQAIQREIDRFEENFPHEFERAQEQIREAGAEMTAERQEEFASRGMFYSSVMANSVSKIDEQTMDQINEIARDAANYVADLHRDLKDVEEWAAVEREIMRHQIATEERELGMQLGRMHLEVMKHGDQYQLDAWAQEERNRLNARQQQLQEFEVNLQQQLEAESAWGMAQVARHPLMEDFMDGIGLSMDEFSRMPLHTQMQIAQQAPAFLEFQQNMQRSDLENRILGVEALIQETYGEAQAEQAFELHGLELEEAKLRVQEYDAQVQAKLGTNYFERMANLDIRQTSAQLGLTEAQTALVKTQSAAQKQEAALLEREMEDAEQGLIFTDDSERIDYIDIMISRASEEGRQGHWQMSWASLREGQRIAEQIEDPGFRESYLDRIDRTYNALLDAGGEQWNEKMKQERRETSEDYMSADVDPSAPWYDRAAQYIFSLVGSPFAEEGTDTDFSIRGEGRDVRSDDELRNLGVTNFSVDEFRCRGTGQLKIDSRLAQGLQQMRDMIGKPIRITSGYRAPEYNATLSGAAPNSRHTTGEAADIVVDGMSPQQVAQYAEKVFGDGGIGVYSGHVHVDVGPKRRW